MPRDNGLVFATLLVFLRSSWGAQVCYGSLGCFQSYSNIPTPQSPSHIATKFLLHVRGSSTAQALPSVGYSSHIDGWTATFDSSKQTKVIIHGYLDNGDRDWVEQMTAELFKKVIDPWFEV